MEQKPLHYDGSVQTEGEHQQTSSEPLKITDEIRKNLGGNPYFIEINE
ncbi:hypothetical protein [Metabacillus idriensis]